MNREIIITKHALEEYIKDNPLKKNPKRKLEYLFTEMLWKTKTKEAKFRRFENKTSIMIYKEQVIIFNNYVIITYYRLYDKETREYRNWQKSLIFLLINNEKVYKIKQKPKKKKWRMLPSIKRNLLYKK